MLCATQVLQTDGEDVCNPDQHFYNMPLWEREYKQQLRDDTPALAHCVDAMFNLPSLLADALQVQLRVPQ